jgi:acetylornithine deacetylase
MNFYAQCSNDLFSVKDVMKKLQEYVDDINENIQKLETRGPVSKYVLSDENLRGRWGF